MGVKDAIQATTAEKIKAKRTEEEMNKLNENSNKNYDSFDTRLNYAVYKTDKYHTVDDGMGGEVKVYVTKAAENIQTWHPK